MATSALFQLNFSTLLPRLAARVIRKCKLLAHLPVAAHLSSSCRWILWQTSSYSYTPPATLEKCICHLQCALITRKITTLVWWPTNRAQIHANIGAIASPSSQLRDLHAECERGPTNQLSLVQLSLCSLLLVLHHLLCSCVQLHSAHSQLPFAVLNLVRLHRQRQRQRQRDWQSAWLSHYATVWLSGSLTIWQFWLLGCLAFVLRRLPHYVRQLLLATCSFQCTQISP